MLSEAKHLAGPSDQASSLHFPLRGISTLRMTITLVIILGVAVALRLYHLGHQSFWCDEFLTAEMTVGRGYQHEKIPANSIVTSPPELTRLKTPGSLWSLWTHQVDEGYPPLYVLIARIWRWLAGEGDAQLRLLSVVGSLLMIGLLFDAVRVQHGTSAALWAAGIAAVATPQIVYAQEARAYALLMAEGMGACAALVRMENHGVTRARLMALGGCAAAMLLTHYYAYGAVAALFAYAGLRLSRQRRAAVITMIVVGLIALVLWAPLALRQIDAAHIAGTRLYFGDDAPGRIWRLLVRLARLPVHFFYEPMRGETLIELIGSVIYLTIVILAWRRRELRVWAAWVFAVLLPIALIDLLAKTRQLEQIRYTLLASPALYALAAAAAAPARRLVRHGIPLIIVLACILSLNTAYAPWKANWRGLAAQWGEVARPGEITIFSGSKVVGPYSPSVTYLSASFYRRPPGPIVILEQPPSPQLLDEMRRAPSVLLIASELSSPPEEMLPGCRFQRVGFEPYVGKIYRVSSTGP